MLKKRRRIEVSSERRAMCSRQYRRSSERYLVYFLVCMSCVCMLSFVFMHRNWSDCEAASYHIGFIWWQAERERRYAFPSALPFSAVFVFFSCAGPDLERASGLPATVPASTSSSCASAGLGVDSSCGARTSSLFVDIVCAVCFLSIASTYSVWLITV